MAKHILNLTFIVTKAYYYLCTFIMRIVISGLAAVIDADIVDRRCTAAIMDNL
jgi:hypothetical protein